MKWIKDHIFLSWFISALALLFVLLTTNPERVGPQGVTIFFGLFYLFMFFTMALFIRFLGTHRGKSLKQSNYFFMIATLAAIPTFILALQSLRQLILRDVFIILSLAVLVIFYWTKRGTN